MEGQLLFWSCFTIRAEVCYHALQRTTTAIAYMFKPEFNFACINYVVDFGGVEKDHTTASTAFHQLANLFQRLGLESSPSKDWVPSTRMLFLGLVYDTLKMSIEVPQDKLDKITRLVRAWLNSSSATKTALQSLIGKLACLCLHQSGPYLYATHAKRIGLAHSQAATLPSQPLDACRFRMVERFPSFIQWCVPDSFRTSDQYPLTILPRRLPPWNRGVLWWAILSCHLP